MPTNIAVPDEIHARLRVAAALEGVRLTAITAKALTQWLEARDKRLRSRNGKATR